MDARCGEEERGELEKDTFEAVEVPVHGCPAESLLICIHERTYGRTATG
jgi:hypothetical protein